MHQASDWVAGTQPTRTDTASISSTRSSLRLARRLGLGILSVRLRDGHVEELAAPGPYAPQKSKKKKARLEKAFDRLRGFASRLRMLLLPTTAAINATVVAEKANP